MVPVTWCVKKYKKSYIVSIFCSPLSSLQIERNEKGLPLMAYLSPHSPKLSPWRSEISHSLIYFPSSKIHSETNHIRVLISKSRGREYRKYTTDDRDLYICEWIWNATLNCSLSVRNFIPGMSRNQTGKPLYIRKIDENIWWIQSKAKN